MSDMNLYYAVTSLADFQFKIISFFFLSLLFHRELDALDV